MRLCLTLGAALLVLGLGLALAVLARGTSRARPQADEVRSQDEALAEPAARVERSRLESVLAAEATAPTRSNVAQPPDAPEVDEAHVVVESPGIATPIRGVVLDSEGHPVAGAKVWFEVCASFGTGRPDIALTVSSILPESRIPGSAVEVDKYGEFTLEETRTGDGGHMCAAAPSFPDEILRGEVDPTQVSQVLQFPQIPDQNSTWIVDVVDANARPLPVTSADVRFIKRTRAGPIREPRQDQIEVRRGLVVVRGLAPGVWELHVEVPDSLGGHKTWSIESPLSTERSQIVVEQFPGGSLVSTTIESTDDHLPWVDEAAAITLEIKKKRLALGEQAIDRHFLATLKAGFGAMRAVELVVDLSASQFLCENDTLSLEYVQDRGFAWSRSIQDLVQVDWIPGATARLRLDLARLPLADGTTLDLREHLADGLLDVVVQDDTAIDGLWLRIVR